MIRRSTVVYLLIFVVLVGVYAYLQYREPIATDAESTPTVEAAEETRYLYTPADGMPTGIRIVAKSGGLVELARDAENAWRVILPIEAAADQGALEAAASQVSSMRVLESIADIDLELVGVNDPDYIVNLVFANGQERTLKVGVVTPTESGYYVQEASGGDVLIVSKSALDALLGLLTSPPYAETPTPSPVPTETVPPSPVDETATPAS